MKNFTHQAPLAHGKTLCSMLILGILLLATSASLLKAQPVSYEMAHEPGDTNDGDPVDLVVYLGTASEPVSSTSHLVFSFTYDPETYEPGSSMSLDLSNSFFIGPGDQYSASVSADEQARTITLDIENLSGNGSGYGEVARVVGGLMVVVDVFKDDELLSSSREAGVKLYPTIVSDHFKVRGQEIGGTWLEVLNLQGEIVERIQVPVGRMEYKVPAEGLSNGLYKVRMAAEDAAQAVIGSFIKQQ